MCISKRFQKKNAMIPILTGTVLVLCLAGCQGTKASNFKVDPLPQFKGDVAVLLLGKSGCPGTEKATRFLKKYNKSLPQGATVARIDVPPVGKKLKEPSRWDAGFHYEIDHDRVAAEKLAFFYYPTLYILDRDGEVRYQGECDKDRVPEIVQKLVAEKPGAKKKLYSPIMPAVGEVAKSFSGPSMEGTHLSLKELRGTSATLLVFGSTTCPFSATAVAHLPAIQAEFQSQGVSALIVNVGESESPLKEFYSKKAPGVPVVADKDSKIGKGIYGIQGVPFFYLLDKNGCIADRMPFTAEAAREAVNALLGGRKSSARKKAASGAG